MTQVYKRIVQSQVDAAFAMLEYCIRNCPAKKWNGTIGKYPFWQVAYHALSNVVLPHWWAKLRHAGVVRQTAVDSFNDI